MSAQSDPGAVARARAAFDEHLDAVAAGDATRIAAGYGTDARLLPARGEPVEGSAAIGAWFASRRDFFAEMALRPERIEIRPGCASIDWWGTNGTEHFEGRDEFDIDAHGRIVEQRIPRVGRTSRGSAGVRVEIEPPLARLVLDRDDKHNAVSQAMLVAMTAFVGEIGADPSVRALVVSGEGRSFCAGEDVGGFDFPDPQTATRFLAGPLDFFTALEELPKPVVIAVHGHALGFGSEILLAADAVYATRDATFGFAEIDHGAVPSVLVTRGLGVVFRRRALDLALTGRRFEAAEAYEMRLVHQVVDDPLAAAHAAARQMAAWAPAAVAVIKTVTGREAADDHDRAREFMPAVLIGVEPAL